MWTSLLLALAPLVALVTAHPVEERQNGLTVINNCYNRGQVALTFDDGPYNYEGDVAKAFNGQKATFFLNGNNYMCIYDRAQQVRDLHNAGHILGSHTWSHRDMTKLSEADINYELQRVEDALIKILGLKPLYFRPPYGAHNDLVLQVLAQRGYKKLFLWSEDTLDADGGSLETAENVIDNISRDAPNPHMVLSHSTIQSTANQLTPYAVGRLNNAGYQLVAVDTCLGSSGEYPYQYVGEPSSPDGSWTCS